jgi:hypothetical protein
MPANFTFVAKPNGVEVRRDLNAMQTEILGVISWATLDKLAAMRPPKPGPENAG